MNRRGFIGSILAAGVAPAIVRADSLMRIVPRETAVLIPRVGDLYTLFGRSDTEQFYISLHTFAPHESIVSEAVYRDYSRASFPSPGRISWIGSA